ncbi:nicalin isoform X2 [Prionailurus viverrinus]|uniref:nicalin isoform X2 n=1 Tax=Prionailurus viverrinus TaxID=61388 RepID=UPI001FF15C7B|nr:nicalin isoform X2 [Prionailurus viverrinus]
MLEEAGEVLENMLKASCLPLGFIVFLPAVLLLVAPPLPAADAAHEFTVYRMQQYDLQGQPYGTRNAVLNTEARTIDADVLSRRCVLMRLLDFSYEQYQKALRQSAGAVVIILPRAMAAVPQDVIRQFMETEPEMLAMETVVPVYFAVEDEALLSIYEQTQAASAAQGSASAAEVLLHTATANGFQMVTSGVQSKAVSDWLITSVEGRLTGLGGEDLPTIVIVAHYDAFGVAPWLSHGADSNGSGISVLLELARLFSRLYTYKRTHAAYNLLFFASGGGKFNYQGTKRWLEDNLDHTDSSLLQDNVAFVLCLDTVGRGDSLHLHVSKPPREGTLQHAFLRELETVAAHQFPEVRFSMVHKKINLAEDILAWEHERFAIRRLPAFTLSHLESHRDGQRSSIMDVRSRVDSKTLTRNTRLIAEALTRVIYNLTEKGTPPDMPVFTEQMIQQEQLDSVMDWLTNQPRAAQLVDKDGTFLSTLEHYLSRYLKEVKQHHIKADKRDPEFVFYDQLKQVMNAYRVKPAIFDLLLAVCIGAYLGMAYTAVQNRSETAREGQDAVTPPPATPPHATAGRHPELQRFSVLLLRTWGVLSLFCPVNSMGGAFGGGPGAGPWTWGQVCGRAPRPGGDPPALRVHGLQDDQKGARPIPPFARDADWRLQAEGQGAAPLWPCLASHRPVCLVMWVLSLLSAGQHQPISWRLGPPALASRLGCGLGTRVPRAPGLSQPLPSRHARGT